MTLPFTPLERAALEAICRTHPDVREALEAQLATAAVIGRENSGAGFFTYLAVDRSTAPIQSSERVLGGVSASIEGFKQRLLLLLFTKDGYADMLEGATIDDSTVGLDLAAVRFQIDMI
jgi:hypothetical protein